MIKILTKKAYEALKDSVKKAIEELKRLKNSYNNLLEKHERLLNENSDLDKTVKELKDKVRYLTPARDTRGRFISKKQP